MTDDYNDPSQFMGEAERRGKELQELEERNRKRRAKGRKPLPDRTEKMEQGVLRRKYRTGDVTVVDAADAMKLYELRKAQMDGDDDRDDLEEEMDDAATRREKMAKNDSAKHKSPDRRKREVDPEEAVREAAAARRVEDMKNGRIDHEGNWSECGQRLDGGDETVIVDKAALEEAWGPGGGKNQGGENAYGGSPGQATCLMPAAAGLNEFRDDLYRRLRTSFSAIESTLSDLQGRVSEIVTASAKSAQDQAGDGEEGGESEFKELLSRRTPVTFDVNGTKMTFDAVTVFHAPPCITVVSKFGSATIMPKPGARLLLSYEMDGKQYDRDPVTFLGTRFELPMFGLSFVGFIRDMEADMMDASDGTSAGGPGGEGGGMA